MSMKTLAIIGCHHTGFLISNDFFTFLHTDVRRYFVQTHRMSLHKQYTKMNCAYPSIKHFTSEVHDGVFRNVSLQYSAKINLSLLQLNKTTTVEQRCKNHGKHITHAKQSDWEKHRNELARSLPGRCITNIESLTRTGYRSLIMNCTRLNPRQFINR